MVPLAARSDARQDRSAREAPMATIDHVILNVNDIEASTSFYVDVLGFEREGNDGPFTVIRVGEGFVVQLAPWGTSGNEHLAFAMSKDDFWKTFERIKERGIAYGDAFDRVGSNVGPGRETGARGAGPTVYFFDPNHHLIEIRTYEEP
jgi:catechol 2,3-dioxygenase-like lactoylglutathione lyase family enzyme